MELKLGLYAGQSSSYIPNWKSLLYGPGFMREGFSPNRCNKVGSTLLSTVSWCDATLRFYIVELQ